ncbi:DUF1295-domain-containing protein [Hysterangium stoloniferum]|nr:DUF1295-domain-containing protein [Hysterangium stoloniferum]
MVVYVLDQYYLAITVLITIGYQLVGFLIAWTFQFDKITDLTGGSNFFILSILTLCMGGTFHTRNIVASVLVMIWAVRLAGYLLFRVLKLGSDARFDGVRSNFFKFLGVWVVSLPVTILNSPGVSNTSHGGSNPRFGTARDIVGIIMWTIGWSIESIADAQKWRFKSSRPPKDQPPTPGLWKWSRHPPYFGEIICWWGIWILCLSPSTNGTLTGGAKQAQIAAIASPLLTTVILLFGSGIPTAEKPTAERFFILAHAPSSCDQYPDAWTKYKAYLHSTSILIPLPPTLYRPLPTAMKTWLLLDLPIFMYNEKTDGQMALERLKNSPDRNGA